ncbi:MAG: HAMP domain-containing protein [Candidatus Rokubacteria bacterium]|nr:HAMP domain-containing protein [Candidatus Rokubacteria bacterium]
MLHFRTIRARLFTVLVLALGVVVAIVALVWRLAIEPELRAGIVRNQLEVARRAADQIAEFAEHRVSELVATAEIGRLWEGEPSRRKEALYRLLKLDPTIQEVSLIDWTGQEVLRVSRTRVYTGGDLTAYEAEPRFLKPMSGETYVGRVYHARTAEPMMTLAAPIRFTAGDIRGVLAAEVSLKTLWESISNIKIGQRGYGFVVDDRGVLIAHPDASKVLMGLSLAGYAEVGRFLADPGRVSVVGATVVTDHQEPVLSTILDVSPVRWGVVVEEPLADALAGVRRVERLALVVMVLAMAGAFGASYWFSERVARPVRDLQAGAARLAEGRLDHRLAVATGDEVGVLARQFNRMADRVQASHEDLERRIFEKTRDLTALYAVTTPISRAGHLKGVLSDALDRILEISGADGASVQLMGEGGLSLSRLSCATQVEGCELCGPWTELGDVPTDQMTIVEDIEDDTRFYTSALLRDGFRSAACLPLATSAGAFGFILLASREPGRLSPRQADLLTAIAHQIAAAVENARLYEEIRRALAELQARNAELDSFAYSVSHDLKAPLVTIQGMAGMLVEDCAAGLGERGQHYLHRLQANVAQMERLIADILAVSRVGREARPQQAVPVAEVVDEAAERLSELVQAHGVKIVVGDAPVLWGARTEIEQVVGNLVSNALKYLGEQPSPSVEVGGVDRGEFVECWVRDNGIGIAPEYHEQIFQMFQRLNEVPAEGTGVGLALVKRIVERAGGHIWVESAPGQGAMFRFTWPKPPRIA